jgi:hypothetical protein
MVGCNMKSLLILFILVSSVSWAQILTQHTTLTESRFDDTVVVVRDVAMDGDTVVAIGGDWEGKRSTVRVFDQVDGVWILKHYLDTENDHARRVAMDGDTVVVGTRGFPSYTYSSGSAYVFSRTGETWTKRAKLSPDFVQSHMNWAVITQVDVANGTAVTGNRYGAFFFISEGQW